MGVVTAMREIKFRGRGAYQRSVWYVGDLVRCDDGRITIRKDEANEFYVDPETVGQFTGLLDNNGEEIYEGDIVRFELPPMVLTNEKTAVGVVVYEYGQFLVIIQAMRFTIFSIINDCTVIGNVHDNPELIKK